jgi:hypothetical protein
MVPVFKNFDLKLILLRKWGSQRRAALDLRISEQELSEIVCGYRPSDPYLPKFAKGLTPQEMRTAFGNR